MWGRSRQELCVAVAPADGGAAGSQVQRERPDPDRCVWGGGGGNRMWPDGGPGARPRAWLLDARTGQPSFPGLGSPHLETSSSPPPSFGRSACSFQGPGSVPPTPGGLGICILRGISAPPPRRGPWVWKWLGR